MLASLYSNLLADVANTATILTFIGIVGGLIWKSFKRPPQDPAE